jgi:predicted PurR-regulated permease PerM
MSTNKTFLTLVALVTLAFGWVLWPLFGAVFWALTLAIVFAPLHNAVLARLGGRRNLAAVVMILGLLVVVILPLLLIVAAVVQQASTLVVAVSSGAVDLLGIAEQALNDLPLWVQDLVKSLGPKDLPALQDSLANSISAWLGANVPLVFSIGQSTVGLVVGLGVMLYLVFFLFRDGKELTATFTAAIPMPHEVRSNLLTTFTTVVRATVQGDILVALLQGTLGGLGFWVLGIHAAILWTVLMSLLALLPVFGAALVWAPVAVYFMATGHVVAGLGLLAYGTLVISLVDNLVRPYLVGKATRIPDFVVLLSTIGGIASFGVQGFITGPVVAAMFIAVWRTFLAQK